MRLAAPVTTGSGRLTLTLQDLIATDEATELTYHVAGLVGDEGYGPHQDVVTVRDGHEEQVLRKGSFSSAPDEEGRLRRRLASGSVIAPRSGPLGITIAIEGIGELALTAELIPFGPETHSIRYEANASTTHEGVTITVHGVGAAREETAIEVEAAAESGIFAGLGGLYGHRRGPTALLLRDDKGRVYAERWQDPGRYHLTLALFEPLRPDARELELTVPYVFVEDPVLSGEVSLADLPARGSLGPYPIRVLGVSPVAHDRPAVDADSRPLARTLAIDVDLGGWQGDRRVLQPGTVSIDSSWRTMRFGGSNLAEPEPITRVEVSGGPNLAARSLTIARPIVQIRGPWLVRFPLTV